jgi:hypothetical protein
MTLGSRFVPARQVLAASVLAALVLAVPDAAAPRTPQPPTASAAVPAEWLTPAETAGFGATPSYDETLAFLRRVVAASPEMRLTFYGSSTAGRPLPLVIVSKEKRFTAEREVGQDQEGKRAADDKPVVLIQNGIHAGEIDGKDACLMILRDLALGRRRELLDGATLLVLPIYNVDGHERVSPFNRPNQDGPRAGMGFRTTSDGHDLNRDYLKLDSEEARSLLALFNAWRPHLVVDDHVTDGSDHDWVLTTSWAEAPQIAAPLDGWLRRHLAAALAATARAGHRNGPYVDLIDANDPSRGFASQAGPPRYSTGYFPLRNRPAILVETHSYKPYRDRVLANRDFLLALLGEIARDPGELVEAVAAAERQTIDMGRAEAPPSQVVLRWGAAQPADRIRFPVYDWSVETSLVTGQPLAVYHPGKVREIEVPWSHRPRAELVQPRPRGYLVLPGWPAIEARLRGHGLRVERLRQAAELEVEALRVADPKPAAASYQGLTRVEAKVERGRERRTVPAGALWVPADQPDFEVAVQLLEPEAPDSLLSWGLLSAVFEAKEYIEPRTLENLAKQQLRDPAAAAAWQAALADPRFAADPAARFLWWYRRTPYWDATVGLLPYFRVLAVKDGAPASPGAAPAP